MQIDSYGFEATSQFFKRKELSAHLVKKIDGILYVAYSAAPKGPIHRIDTASDGSLRVMWAYGEWARAASLTYVPINETLEVEREE